MEYYFVFHFLVAEIAIFKLLLILDEQALVQAAKDFGYVFNKRTPQSITVKQVRALKKTYLDVLILEDLQEMFSIYKMEIWVF